MGQEKFELVQTETTRIRFLLFDEKIFKLMSVNYYPAVKFTMVGLKKYQKDLKMEVFK